MVDKYDFAVSPAKDGEYSGGLRSFFEYRDLGICDATKGDYVAHVIRATQAVPRGSSERTGKYTTRSASKWYMCCGDG